MLFDTSGEKIVSDAISRAVQIAVDHQNEIESITDGWSEARQVVHMRHRLTEEARAVIALDATLRYWSSERTPHCPAEEGFSDGDNEDKVVIAFYRD